MQEASIRNAQLYASRHDLQVAERLGYGVHGIVLVAEGKGKPGKTAVRHTMISNPTGRSGKFISDSRKQG
jgi:hypothetical protein